MAPSCGPRYTPPHIKIVWNLTLEGIIPITVALSNFLESLLIFIMGITVGHVKFQPTLDLWYRLVWATLITFLENQYGQLFSFCVVIK